jgi:hypothetical protein
MFEFIRRLLKQGQPAHRQLRARLCVELLELRWCPAAGMWTWIGRAGGDHLWSNPGGNNWQDPTGAIAAPLNYPGLAVNDQVAFDNGLAGPATLDVGGLKSLLTLQFTGWAGQLTLNQALYVAGSGGHFQLTDGSQFS